MTEPATSYTVSNNDVMADTDLSPRARLLYHLLAGLADVDGYVTVSRAELATQFGRSVRTISTLLVELREQGVVEMIEQPGSPTTYRLHDGRERDPYKRAIEVLRRTARSVNPGNRSGTDGARVTDAPSV